MKILLPLGLLSLLCLAYLGTTVDWSGMSKTFSSATRSADAGPDSPNSSPASFNGSASAGSASGQAAPKLVLMKFGATWCPPCRMIDKELKELGRGDLPVEIRKIDIDRQPQLARKHGVGSIPHVILMEDGQPVDDFVGFRSADQMESWINRSASAAALAVDKSQIGKPMMHSNPFVN